MSERNLAASARIPGLTVSKLMPPADHAGQLARPHLVDSMVGAGNARLILLRAGAGFGKTTLLQQYAAYYRTQPHDLVWLRADTADNDLQRFLLHLDAGLNTAQKTPATALGHVDLASHLIERISASTRALSLLFDDFETIHSEPVLDFTRRLIEALPPGSHLVIASRATPDVGIGRLRARGELLDITSIALRFSLAETSAFIREKCGLALRDSEIESLCRRTEGWAAALYLATLSLRSRSNHAAFIASFSGTNLELAEYLAEDILARQSPACRTFLLETSILPQLSAELCDVITQRSDSRAMLDYLERANLFITPLDTERYRYRYHPLFASFLKHRLHQEDPQRERALHMAAAQWHRDDARPVPAVEHLLDAGCTDAALELIEQCSPALLGAGRVRLMMRWFDRIGPTKASLHGLAGPIRAWVLLLNRRYDEAMRVAEQVLVAREGQRDHEALVLEAEAIRAMLYALTGEVEACQQTGALTLDRLSQEATYVYDNLAHSLAYSYIATANYDKARGVLSRALQRTQGARLTRARAIAETLESMIDLTQARLGTALARLEAALALGWDTDRGELEGGRLSLDTVRALALYETDALDAAEHLLDVALPLVKDNAPPDSLIVCYILSARIALAHDEREQWERLLAELEQTGSQFKDERVIASAWLERARVASLETRLDAAREALHVAELHSGWDRPGVSFHANDVELPAIGRARLALAEQKPAEAEREISQAIRQAQAQLRYRRVLKLRILHALALDGLGNRREAFDVLTEALRMASHEGFLRTFIEEGPILTTLLHEWAQLHLSQLSTLGILPRFIEALLARISPLQPESGDMAGMTDTTPIVHAASAMLTGGMAVETLTARECDVLRVLSDGHRNREIAEKLFVSELTVKSHLRSINAKLGATNRTQAVAIGRSLGLI